MLNAKAVLKLQTESKSYNKNQSYEKNSYPQNWLQVQICTKPKNIITFELKTPDIKWIYQLNREGFTHSEKENCKEKSQIKQKLQSFESEILNCWTANQTLPPHLSQKETFFSLKSKTQKSKEYLTEIEKDLLILKKKIAKRKNKYNRSYKPLNLKDWTAKRQIKRSRHTFRK